GGEGEGVDGPGVSAEGAQVLAGAGVPELDLGGEQQPGRGGDALPVGTEGDGVDDVGVAAEVEDALAAAPVPDADGGVAAGGDEGGAVGVERQAGDAARVFQDVDGAAAAEAPEVMPLDVSEIRRAGLEQGEGARNLVLLALALGAGDAA